MLGQRTHARPAARAGPHTTLSRGRARALAALCVTLGGSGEAQQGLCWAPEQAIVPQAQGGMSNQSARDGGPRAAQSRGGNFPARVGGALGGRREGLQARSSRTERRRWRAARHTAEHRLRVTLHRRALPRAAAPACGPPASPLRHPGRFRRGSMDHRPGAGSGRGLAPQALGRAEGRRRRCICSVRLHQALAASPRAYFLSFLHCCRSRAMQKT
jgi:hypothetical protein